MSGKQPEEHPLDPAALKADNELIENLNAGDEPPADELGQMLGAWRDETQR